MIPLFDKGNKHRYLLFKHLLYKNRECSLIELSHNTKISKNSILKYLHQVDLDLKLLYKSNELSITKNKDGFQLINNTQLPANFLIDKLKLFYLQKSLKYQMLETLLTNGATSVEELSINLYISVPNTYKKLKELEPILEEFHLTIKFGNKLTSNLVGTEKDLRTFIFFFFWNTYKGIEQVREHDCSETFHTKMNFDYSKMILQKHSSFNRMTSLVTMCAWRIEVKKAYIDLNPEIQTIFEQFSFINDVSMDLKTNISPIDPQQLKQETLYFNYMARLQIGNIDSNQQKRQIALQLLELDSTLIQSSKELLEQFLKHFQLTLSLDEHLLYFYHITLLQLYLFYTNSYPEKLMTKPIAIPDTLKDEDYVSSISQEIKKFYHHFLQTSSFKQELAVDPHFAPVAHSLLYFLLEFQHSFKLKIYIQYSKKNYGEELIEAKIFQIFSKDHLVITSDVTKADFIISDSYEQNACDTPLFYLEDIFNPQIWEVLISKIQHLLFLQSFNK